MREEYGSAGEERGGQGGEEDVGAAAGDLERKERNYFVRQIIIFGEFTRVRKSRKSGNKAGQIL